MTITTSLISPLYTIGEEVVFYKKDLYKDLNALNASLLSGSAVGMDIFGNVLDPQTASTYLLRMVDYSPELTYAEKVLHNIQVGTWLVALWREWVVSTGITGQGLVQLQSFASIGLGLLMGCLYEASTLISALPEDEIVTPAIKTRFATACLVADRLS